MTARDGLQKLIVHFGTERAPRKTKKPQSQHAKTAVPVVPMRIPTTKPHGETDYLAETLRRLRPDVNLTHDFVLTIRSTLCALLDREIYRGRHKYALGAL